MFEVVGVLGTPIVFNHRIDPWNSTEENCVWIEQTSNSFTYIKSEGVHLYKRVNITPSFKS